MLRWLSSTIGARGSALVASAVVHSTLAVAAISGGHAPAAPTPAPADEVDVQTIAEPVPTPPRVESREAPAPSHTHPYPVPLDHDAHPHDPSLVHHVADHTPEPARATEAMPVMEAPPAATPRFFSDRDRGRGGRQRAVEREAGAARGGGRRAAGGAPAFYPRAARAAEVEADVILEIVLDATGRVAQARLAKGAAGFGLDESALQAIRGYRFSRGRTDGPCGCACAGRCSSDCAEGRDASSLTGGKGSPSSVAEQSPLALRPSWA